MCLKCCFSTSIVKIKVFTEKFTNFDFFECTLIWHLSQYNLIKLFWMKLKATKCYLSHHMEKLNEPFSQSSKIASAIERCRLDIWKTWQFGFYQLSNPSWPVYMTLISCGWNPLSLSCLLLEEVRSVYWVGTKCFGSLPTQKASCHIEESNSCMQGTQE